MKLLLKIILSAVMIFTLAPATVFAQRVGILPRPSKDCNTLMKEQDFRSAYSDKDAFKRFIHKDQKDDAAALRRDDVLACAVKTGRIRLFMVAFFVTYLIEFLLEIAGLIAVLFVVYGGYLYVVGGISEDKEKGKKAIQHALIGLLIAISSWMVVNFVQVALTS